jgi:hypothetical protein
MNTPTEPSKLRLLPVVPRPRMMTLAVELEMLVARNVIDGLTAWMLEMFSTRAVASASPLAAVIAIGTFWRFSARRCAVTTISWSPVP